MGQLWTGGSTAAASASKVEAVLLSPTNMAAANIAAVDFNKMMSRDRPACGHIRWGRSANESTASNASAVLIGRTKSREFVYGRVGFLRLHVGGLLV